MRWWLSEGDGSVLIICVLAWMDRRDGASGSEALSRQTADESPEHEEESGHYGECSKESGAIKRKDEPKRT